MILSDTVTYPDFTGFLWAALVVLGIMVATVAAGIALMVACAAKSFDLLRSGSRAGWLFLAFAVSLLAVLAAFTTWLVLLLRP